MIKMEMDKNMQFMQIAMKHLPEGKALLEQKGIELGL
jgi:competence protein ComZ